MGNLTFKEVDHAKYPAVDLAYAAGRSGGTMTGVLSAANEKVATLPIFHFSNSACIPIQLMRLHSFLQLITLLALCQNHDDSRPGY